MKQTASLALIFLLSGLFFSCDNHSNKTRDSRYADEVVSAPGATGTGYGDSTKAVDGVHGGGCTGGNTADVYSLSNNSSDENTYIILRWSGRRVTNGTGTDFAVFENPFDYDTCGSGNAFMEHIIISLSIDGLEWIDFPHDYTAGDETVYSTSQADWSGFAGVTAVLFNEDSNPVDPFDAAAAGGDHFDLDNLPDTDLGNLIKDEGFVYIKLTAAASVNNPDTAEGEHFVHENISTGPDIDGVYASYFKEE